MLPLAELRALNNGAGESMANFTNTAHTSTFTFVLEEHADYPGLALTMNVEIARSSRIIKALLPECLVTTSWEREQYAVVLELQTSRIRVCDSIFCNRKIYSQASEANRLSNCTSQPIQEMLTHKQNCTASISQGKVIKLVAPGWSVDA
jgi:hypothetical protein